MEKWMECWLNLKEEDEPKVMQLISILKRAKNTRIKQKLAKRIKQICLN